MSIPVIHLRDWGRADYATVWQAMQAFTRERTPASVDEIWQVEHPGVFTLGQAGRDAHVLNPGQIPLVRTDRGGQVTYHGPGQVVLYPLIQLRRYGLGVRRWVSVLENTVVTWLAGKGIEAAPRADAPGVYVDGAKIAALGLRVRKGCSYHGLAVNVAMDLAPFARINPCGYAGLAVTDCAQLGVHSTMAEAFGELTQTLVAELEAQCGEPLRCTHI